jgi:hypothetical protein
MKWHEFQSSFQVREHFRDIADGIRSKQLDLGRTHYALTLAVGVMEAIMCNCGRLVAIEFGVGAGGGLLSLCKAAKFFRDQMDIEIDVYGLDRGIGLPPPDDHRDHPELWHTGQYAMDKMGELRASLPEFAHLVIGDIADTAATLRQAFEGRKLAFVSIDVDYYSSTKSALEVLRFDPSYYLPAVPMYFDDIMEAHLMHNSWCGEPLAIAEFNSENEFRKIEANKRYNIPRFHACHILDHPLRRGQEKLRDRFTFLHLIALDPKTPK